MMTILLQEEALSFTERSIDWSKGRTRIARLIVKCSGCPLREPWNAALQRHRFKSMPFYKAGMFPNDVGGGRIMFQLFRAHDDRALCQESNGAGISIGRLSLITGKPLWIAFSGLNYRKNYTHRMQAQLPRVVRKLGRM
jgi:hypothetical protein